MTTTTRLQLCGLVLALAIPRVNHAWAQQATTVSPHGPRTLSCAGCHRPDAWKPARLTTFQHPASFPLVGAHATAGCASCHTKLDFSATDTRCASCHRDPHLGELGNECARCHTTRSFIDRSAMLRAHQLTRFPLTGAHRAADCEACHVPAGQGQRRFAGRSMDCTGCHQVQLHAAKNPDHVAAGFSTQCGSCHAPTSWNRAAYDHSGTSFPLTGAHRALSCNTCHADAVYRGKASACVSCHLQDYQGTTNPSHAAAQFPTTCASCHRTTRWSDATFNHDGLYFPIYSGAHRGRWTTCATCHTSASDYRVFTCLQCHGQASTNNAHRDVSGYSYTSQSCYACHRNGRAD